MITYDIDLCLGIDNQGSAITVKCCDTGVNIRAHLYVCRHGKWRDMHEAYTIPAGCTPVIKIAKPDKTYFVKDGLVQAGGILFETKAQAFSASGTAEAEVSLFAENGERITTASFTINIPPECTSKCEGESGDYVDVMSEQIKAAIDAAERAEAAAERAEAAASGGGGGTGGENGATFTPHVTEEGDLSWTNDKGLPNPEPVNIKGKDGYTPKKNVDYFDGIDGKDGEPGKDGQNGTDGVSVTHSWDGTVLTVTSASGTSSVDLKGEPGKDGQNGIDGKPGADGYTPVKGTDYWTESDRTQMVADVISALPVYNGEVV